MDLTPSTTAAPRHKTLLWLLMASFIALAPSAAFAERNTSWKVIKNKSGIKVKKKYIPNYTLPVIRGESVLSANIYDVLAVINDVGKSCKWMADCKDTRILVKRSDFDLVVYNRTGTPWPLDDRDVVVQTEIKIDKAKQRVLIDFYSIDGHKGKVSGVVRMPTFRGKYILEKLGDQKTRIIYQAQADVGGNVPDWVAEIKSESIPYDTIHALRDRVKKTSKTNEYQSFIKKWDPKQGGQGF